MNDECRYEKTNRYSEATRAQLTHSSDWLGFYLTTATMKSRSRERQRENRGRKKKMSIERGGGRQRTEGGFRQVRRAWQGKIKFGKSTSLI